MSDEGPARLKTVIDSTSHVLDRTRWIAEIVRGMRAREYEPSGHSVDDLRKIRTTLRAESWQRETDVTHPYANELAVHHRVKWGVELWTDCSACIEMLARNAAKRRRPIDKTPNEPCYACAQASLTPRQT